MTKRTKEFKKKEKREKDNEGNRKTECGFFQKKNLFVGLFEAAVHNSFCPTFFAKIPEIEFINDVKDKLKQEARESLLKGKDQYS